MVPTGHWLGRLLVDTDGRRYGSTSALSGSTPPAADYDCEESVSPPRAAAVPYCVSTICYCDRSNRGRRRRHRRCRRSRPTGRRPSASADAAAAAAAAPRAAAALATCEQPSRLLCPPGECFPWRLFTAPGVTFQPEISLPWELDARRTSRSAYFDRWFTV